MARVTSSRKKQLQEPDEFHTVSQHAWLWLHDNRDRAGMIAGGIVAAVLVAVGVKAYVDRSHSQRAADVGGAVARYVAAAGTATPELRHDLATLADRHQGSAEGAVARYFQAGALAASGDADQAGRIFTELSAGGAPADIGVLSRVALAYLDLARGAGDAALASFQELLKVQGTAVPRAQLLAEIGAIHEKQGRPAEARRAYQDLIAEYPDGSWVGAAKQRLRLLAERGTPAS